MFKALFILWNGEEIEIDDSEHHAGQVRSPYSLFVNKIIEMHGNKGCYSSFDVRKIYIKDIHRAIFTTRHFSNIECIEFADNVYCVQKLIVPFGSVFVKNVPKHIEDIETSTFVTIENMDELLEGDVSIGMSNIF